MLRPVAMAPPASGRVYELTARGRELEPVLHALGRWGSHEGLESVTHDLSVDAFTVALSTVFDPTRARGVDTTLALVVNGDPLVADVHDNVLEIRRGAARPHARLEGSVAALREVLWRGRSLDDAEADGSVIVAGLRAVARKFLTFFPPPVPHRTSK